MVNGGLRRDISGHGCKAMALFVRESKWARR
jgi:hypothetical protein